MRRRKKQEEHVNHERWLVSYADFITLLFAFFVVLYASSQVDKRKVGMLALSIQVAFQEMGVFESSNTKVPMADTEIMPFEKVQVIENVNRTVDFQRIAQPLRGMHSNAALPDSMKNVQADLAKALAPELKSHVVEIKARREGLVVSLEEVGFYESGSAALRSSGRDAVDRLVTILAKRSEALRIEGHTDDVPIHNAQFASNWELSTARATELIKLFILRYQIPAQRLSAAGFAQYHPLDSNGTPEGRARNRRVDIVILAPQRVIDALVEDSPPPSASSKP
jgi:chemotaxis protein MotB